MSAHLLISVAVSIDILRADKSFKIEVNASNILSQSIWNPWTCENSADYTTEWDNTEYIDKTNPSIKQQYPFLTHQKFAYATGGCYKGYTDQYNKTCRSHFDLLQDPSNSNSPYNFTQLMLAINNTLKMGLKPYLVTGLIPISYSNNSTLSNAKDLNELPPNDYNKYSQYIQGMAQQLLDIYGDKEIKQWWFGVITEFNNYGHFDDIYNFNATMTEYFKIYDFTECNLKKVFGANNFIIGAHSCRNCPRGDSHSWDPDQLLYHIANEKNFCSNKIGDTQMNFYSSSFYERGPGDPGDQSNFDKYICSMHNAINKYGLQYKVTDIAIDEGRILNDQYGIPLPSRSLGSTYQASWDSLLFYNMIRCNITRFVRWGIDTNGLGIYVSTDNDHVNTIQPIAANVIRLTYKMTGDKMLNMSISINQFDNDSDNNTQIVNGIASIADNGTMRVFIFNHNSELYSKQTANLTLNVCDVKNINGDGKTCKITEWRIDDNNAQFWNIYWNDVMEYNITSFCPYGWSNQGEQICISDEKGHNYIQNRTPIYQNASRLIPYKYEIDYEINKCLLVTKELLPTHSVRLFEISC